MSLLRRVEGYEPDEGPPRAGSPQPVIIVGPWPECSPLVPHAFLELTSDQREAVTAARRLLPARERHVALAWWFAERAREASDDCSADEARYGRRVSRPRWLSPAFNRGATVALVGGGVSAGLSALDVLGEAVAPSAPTLVGVALVAVAVGSRAGSQTRCRQQGHPGGPVELVAAVILAGSMLGLSRRETAGAVLAVLVIAGLGVAIGSAVLGYLFHDPLADRIVESRQRHQALARRARAELDHSTVRRFEAAEAQLRAGVVEAVRAARRRLRRRRQASEQADVANQAHDVGLVEELLAAVVGPEVLALTPKGEAERSLRQCERRDEPGWPRPGRGGTR
jgi:hypothetical protein